MHELFERKNETAELEKTIVHEADVDEACRYFSTVLTMLAVVSPKTIATTQ